MTKNEFLKQFDDELRRRNINDADEITEEYRQHFTFKLADGYSEEEIAAKLGDPVKLAMQFEQTEKPQSVGGRKPVVVIGLCIADVFAGLFFIMLAAWGLVMAACAISSIAVAAALFGEFNIYEIIPDMPYWCGVILAISFTALTALIAVGCIYYTAFLRQLLKSFARFQHNVLASASGRATLPPVAINPQIPAKTNRRLRSTALISLLMFAACFVLAYIVCSLSAGTMEFWHSWGWFE